jgi:hypothetical protein
MLVLGAPSVVKYLKFSLQGSSNNWGLRVNNGFVEIKLLLLAD